MGKLTTHVLDTARGKPAAAMKIELWFAGTKLKSATTNSDGRVDEPLLSGESFKSGAYQLVFHVGAYFRESGMSDGGAFLESVPVSFVVADAAGNYHVPLLVSPWAYSTYKGS